MENIENLDKYVDMGVEMAIEYGPKVVLAIVVLIIGLSVIKSITVFLRSIMTKREVDPTLTPFLVNLVGWGFKVLLIVSVASMGWCGNHIICCRYWCGRFGNCLALQGSLANFAGGVLILIFRPFKKGDYIQAQGHEGSVESIDVFATIIKTVDNKKIIIPNGPLAGGAIHNYTAEDIRRVDLSIGIGYNDDIKNAIGVLSKCALDHPKVLKVPAAPFVGVTSYGDSSINLCLRSWTKTEDYWAVFFDLNQQMKYTLDENKISIPFPQREVKVIKES